MPYRPSVRSPAVRPRTGAALLLLTLLVASGWVAARAPLRLDYVSTGTTVDAARPQVDALVELDLPRFVRHQSPLGPVSLVLRAPFAALAAADDQLARYRLGSFVCLLTFGIAALAVATAMRRRGSPLWHCALTSGVIFFTPVVHETLVWGHPEELLATAFIVAAMLLADTGRGTAAIAAAGLAVATKPWAALALVPIGLMVGGHVVRNVLL